ncbi:hypothetical protein PSACC_00230 [Paramicrosporidium saccamoebae]|uniref:Uncharacterized protein n=1 Tax=Paramicrosporidium saccamoebae TaxID=1246581 RepID=A0A2H9TQD9_9FUNG|nr:hypothetical protein PSACC_00230 [Paramicrosporidium saccamoebae]
MRLLVAAILTLTSIHASKQGKINTIERELDESYYDVDAAVVPSLRRNVRITIPQESKHQSKKQSQQPKKSGKAKKYEYYSEEYTTESYDSEGSTYEVSDPGSEYIPEVSESDSEYISEVSESDSEYISEVSASDSEYLPGVSASDSEYISEVSESDPDYSPKVSDSGSESISEVSESSPDSSSAPTESEYWSTSDIEDFTDGADDPMEVIETVLKDPTAYTEEVTDVMQQLIDADEIIVAADLAKVLCEKVYRKKAINIRLPSRKLDSQDTQDFHAICEACPNKTSNFMQFCIRKHCHTSLLALGTAGQLGQRHPQRMNFWQDLERQQQQPQQYQPGPARRREPNPNLQSRLDFFQQQEQPMQYQRETPYARVGAGIRERMGAFMQQPQQTVREPMRSTGVSQGVQDRMRAFAQPMNQQTLGPQRGSRLNMDSYSAFNQSAPAPMESRPRYEYASRTQHQQSPQQYSPPEPTPYEAPIQSYENAPREYSEPSFAYELQNAPKAMYDHSPIMSTEPAYLYNEPLLEREGAQPAMPTEEYSYQPEPSPVQYRESGSNVAEMANLMNSRANSFHAPPEYSPPNPYNPGMEGDLDQAIEDLKNIRIKGAGLKSALGVIANSQDASERFMEIKSALQRRTNNNLVDDVILAAKTPGFCQNVFGERSIPLTMPQGNPPKAAQLSKTLEQKRLRTPYDKPTYSPTHLLTHPPTSQPIRKLSSQVLISLLFSSAIAGGYQQSARYRDFGIPQRDQPSKRNVQAARAQFETQPVAPARAPYSQPARRKLDPSRYPQQTSAGYTRSSVAPVQANLVQQRRAAFESAPEPVVRSTPRPVQRAMWSQAVQQEPEEPQNYQNIQFDEKPDDLLKTLSDYNVSGRELSFVLDILVRTPNASDYALPIQRAIQNKIWKGQFGDAAFIVSYPGFCRKVFESSHPIFYLPDSSEADELDNAINLYCS